MAKKAWIVSVTMGYGHMRAARPLREIAGDGSIVAADDYEGIPEGDRRIWVGSRKLYNFISRFSDKGPFGRLIFNIFDYFQRIGDIDEKQIEPTFQLKRGYALIRKGWGRHLIEKLNNESPRQTRGRPVPLIATFFTIGQMAEVWGYKGEIYVLTTDSDISRAWAPLNPKVSRINYLASTETAGKHLESYGVDPKKIHLTGFPLPGELVVGAPLFKSGKRPRVTFAVGGAGAQAEIGEKIIKSLKPLIEKKKVVLNIILGTHRNLSSRFKEEPGVRILSSKTKDEYFTSFNKVIAETDVLWTKPSELSFYAGLGLPIIIAPPLGAQEKKNREWLLKLGCGIDQGNPQEAHKWLPELLKSEKLERAARAGFGKIEKNAVKNISKIVSG
jgi:hypothetical protein